VHKFDSCRGHRARRQRQLDRRECGWHAGWTCCRRAAAGRRARRRCL